MTRRRRINRYRRSDPFTRDIMDITRGTTAGLITLGVGMAGYKLVKGAASK